MAALHEVPCALCGSWRRRRVHRDLHLDGAPTAMWRCGDCGSGYISPRWTGADLLRQYVDPDEQERYYREEYAPIVPGVVASTDRTIALLERFAPVGSLLDYGCGAGVVAAAAARRGWRSVGYDVSPVAARWGRELLDAEVVNDWDAVAARGPFAAVAMVEVIEHLERPLETVRHALSALRPGGVFAISTPNLASLAHLRRGAAWPVVYPEAHILYLTPRALRWALRRCGAEPLATLTWSNEVARLPLPARLGLRDPPGGPALLAFARTR